MAKAKTKELITLDPNVQFEIEKAEISKMIKERKGLKVKSIKDTEGYDAVCEARKELATERIKIDKDRLAITLDARNWVSMVNEKGKELVEMLKEAEGELNKEKKKYEAWLEEERKAEERRIEKRKHQLYLAGCKYDGTQFSIGDFALLEADIPDLKDDEFKDYLQMAKDEGKKIKEQEEKIQAELEELQELRRMKAQFEQTASGEDEPLAFESDKEAIEHCVMEIEKIERPVVKSLSLDKSIEVAFNHLDKAKEILFDLI